MTTRSVLFARCHHLRTLLVYGRFAQGLRRMQFSVSGVMRVMWELSLVQNCQGSLCRGAVDVYMQMVHVPGVPIHLPPLDSLDCRLCVPQLRKDRFHFHVVQIPMAQGSTAYFGIQKPSPSTKANIYIILKQHLMISIQPNICI